MKYIKVTENGEKEISRDEARELVSRNYSEAVSTYDEMLDTLDYIPCMFSGLRIVRD